MQDPTESIRRHEVAQINANPASREALEAKHGQVWDTQELQQDILAKDGVTSTGSWQRSDRAARYRVPGWGDVNWKRVMTALLEVGYDYVLSFEHEDPVMSEEDGCEQAIQFLKPLIIKKPLEPGQAWWLA